MKYFPLMFLLSVFCANAAKLPSEEVIKKRLAEKDLIALNSWKPLKGGDSIKNGGTETAHSKFGLFMINNKVVSSTTTVKDFDDNPVGALPSFAACSRVVESVIGQLTEEQQERVIDMVASAAKVKGYGLTYKILGFHIQTKFLPMGKNMIIDCSIKGDE